MKFALAPVVLAAAALAAPTSLESRQATDWCATSKALWAPGNAESFLYNLVHACIDDTRITDTGNLWAHKVCVAAAMASVSAKDVSPSVVAGLANCENPETITSLQALPSLNYNVYAGIVGDCAWQEGGCPITRQNAIDFVYSALSEIGSQDWPSSVDVVIGGWENILEWTKMGDTVPYLNFNDYLHYYA